MVTVPECRPAEVGVKVTVMVVLLVTTPTVTGTVRLGGDTTNIGLLEDKERTESAAVPVLKIVRL
ncbi:MAG: hypothetical protein A3F84_01745 [Candidatus Handelsmanbacteria bacterium RIFCSPLOWO2_12_FULL_64_10]|uniref:Uncharacterized protein n=1 Tax=Handelsmanbacteria sp. (strain RIFCSPLOWO2_12_FULL_64_10) TaxID=1817868 RepID=A0A1F6D2G4_HANXR|nr:MAG: hypothetical protein A3F84_01745 [Candidatus Handelsmanbacteria bacterium RIFCSPLOWO2_12_FULL_64_10]